MNILKHNGREYTCSNGHTYSRIDWALVNAKWMLDMPIVEVMVMDPGCSDHSPLSLLLAQEEDKRPKPFRFLNHLVKHKKFHENLHNTEFRGVDDKIKECRQKMIDLQSTMKQPGQPMSSVEEEKELKIRLEKWILVEECIAKQKSKVQWLQLGDGNTTYFHACLKNRYAKNGITSLNINEGVVVTKRCEIEREILNFYK
ncbi:hypothetical protein FXO38_10001 [Capsicum annuum]|uniref:Uncharacterized protein n=1 Tax=Capsicum annuum TaxID=4072 RepID=A0A2G3AE29_CAPAN|nr:hypothetical protein FXO38_10001 [Capsicum annuum]PHT92499.1 hypothetical protein T459_00381 [Capsicum annuum]